jgi:HEAT repeat protein
VDALAALLSDEDAEVGECARRALGANPAPAAGRILRERLAGAKAPADRIAYAMALGHRRDEAAVPALGKLLDDGDVSVAVAAAAALGRIGTPAAAQALMRDETGGVKPGSPAARARAAALLECADRLAASGDAEHAGQVYGHLMRNAGRDQASRVAGLLGLLRTDSKTMPERLAAVLGSEEPEDAPLCIAALQAIPHLPGGPEATEAIALRTAKLPPERRAEVLLALAERRDTPARVAALAAVMVEEPALRVAGLEALGVNGTAGCLPVVLERLADGTEAERAAARAALERMPGKDVDPILTRQAVTLEGSLRVALLELLGGRAVTEAVPVLAKAAREGDPAVRAAALRALGQAAGGPDLPALAGLLATVGDLGEAAALKATWDRAWARASEAEREAGAAALVAAYAGAPAAGRAALLDVMGGTGDAAALALLAETARGDDAVLATAAVRALGSWPDAGAMETVLAIAREATDETRHALALRAYVRMADLESAGRPSARAAALAEALEVARRPEEKRLALAGLGKVPSPAALEATVGCLDSKPLAEQAALVVVTIAEKLEVRPKQRETVVAALRRAVVVATNPATVKRAQKVLRKLGADAAPKPIP